MRLGISSYTYGWGVGTDGNRPPGALTALDLVARAAEFRVRVLQLCDNLPAETYEEPMLSRIAAAAREAGVEIQLGTRGSKPGHLRSFIGKCRVTGAKILRVVIDAPGDHPEEAEIVRRVKSVMPDLKSSGVVLAIENHDRFPSAVLRRIIEEIASEHVGICLDTANSFGAMEGPEVVVETLGPVTVNLHVKDVAVRRVPYLQGFTIEGTAAGKGMVRIPWVLERLRQMRRDADAIIEHWVTPEAEMSRTIEKEAQWARESVKTVRQWVLD